jgi:anti-anti-sigma factor
MRVECLTCGLELPHTASASCPKCTARDEIGVDFVVVNDQPSHVPASATGRLRIRKSVRGDTHAIVLAGELDMASGPVVREIIADACANGAQELVLDLTEIEFVDSEGFRVLLEGRALCEEHRCAYCLVPARTPVQHVFELTRVIDRLPFRKWRHPEATPDGASTDS